MVRVSHTVQSWIRDCLCVDGSGFIQAIVFGGATAATHDGGLTRVNLVSIVSS